MARNGAGTYSLPALNPVVTGTVISSTWANNTLTDVANALTASIANDGQTPVTANLPMSTFRHTGVGNGVARTDYAATGQVQDGGFLWCGTGGGTADVITLTPSPAITSYAAGQSFRFVASGANTTNVTVNISTLGAKATTKYGTGVLVAGDITSGAIVQITYDGTRFQLSSIQVDPRSISGVSFPSTTAMLFAQTAAPTGWTKSATHNDKALRVVSGTAGSGGATAFTSVFGAAKTTGSFTLTTNEIPSHTHTVASTNQDDIAGGASGFYAGSSVNSGATGGGASHNHTLSLDLQYVDVIIATKD